MSDLFSQDNVISANVAKWDTIGKSYQGVYVERQIRVGSKFNPNRVAAVYTLIQDDGTPIYVYGKMPVTQLQDGREQEVYVIAGLENAKPGQYVGVKFTGVKENKSANPTKLVQAFSRGEMKLDVLESYQKGKAGMTDAPAEIPEM